jgi:hypothetical protein
MQRQIKLVLIGALTFICMVFAFYKTDYFPISGHFPQKKSVGLLMMMSLVLVAMIVGDVLSQIFKL